MDFKKEKKVALKAANKASKVLLGYFNKKNFIKQKPNCSLVSEADLKANEAIIKEIKKYFPGHDILTEEAEFEDNKSDYKWVVDPLDGTHNFIHGIPIFGTSIALEYKGSVVLGVLQFPFLKLIAVAEKGKGAFLNGKRIKVSNKKETNHSFILFEYSYSKRSEKLAFLQKLVDKIIDVRNFGCAVYGLLLIASGKSDGYIILSTNEWDVAAGFILVEEAGGKITDLKGRKWGFDDMKYVISNGKIHSKLLEFVNV